MILADVPSYNFPIQPGSFLDLLFHQTSLQIQVLGMPKPPYSVNLIGLLILLVIAFAANAITERLTSKKAGGLFTATLITILGSYLFTAYVLLPFDFRLETVRILSALLGAIVIAVFYTLLRGGKK